jgi:hypothetical protein
MTRKGMGPPKRRLRIQNKLRVSVFMSVLIIALLVLFIPSKTDGHVAYKPYKVGYGDTYWHIAKDLQKNGSYPHTPLYHLSVPGIAIPLTVITIRINIRKMPHH